jgi:hypothetical protein
MIDNIQIRGIVYLQSISMFLERPAFFLAASEFNGTTARPENLVAVEISEWACSAVIVSE